MVDRALDVFGQPVRIQRLEGVDDARVKRSSPLLQQAVVGDLVGQRVLERVLERREQVDFVDELGRLQMREPDSQRVFGHAVPAGLRRDRDRAQQRRRHILAHHRHRLQQAFLVGRQPVDSGAENRLHRGRHTDVSDLPRQRIRARLTVESTRFNK